MNRFLICVCAILCGCVQVPDDAPPVTPVTPITPDVTPDNANVNQEFLQKMVADTSLTKQATMRYAAFFRACAQSFRDRTDVPAINLLNACMTSAAQFLDPASPTVTAELKSLESVDKTRDSLSSAFDKLAATCIAAAAKK